jgi:hypothetical protein
MKITFKGWSREIKEHVHFVKPIQNTGTSLRPSLGGPLTWDGALHAHGKIDNLNLGGAFLVEFDFEDKELENWLSVYVKTNPENAIRMLSVAHAEAVVALFNKSDNG